MEKKSTTNWERDKSIKIKTKTGVWMFLVYMVVYVGFILINLINPKLMGANIGSLNLAIVYGFGLIVFALILAFIYNFICSRLEEKMNDDEGNQEEEVRL